MRAGPRRACLKGEQGGEEEWRRHTRASPRSRRQARPRKRTACSRQGFTLIKVMESYTNTPERQFSNIVYVLGRQRSNGETHSTSAQSSPPATSPHRRRSMPLSSRSARGRSTPTEEASGPSTWTGTRTFFPSSRVPADFIERLKGGEGIDVGDYAYRIKDKFLKRFRADGAQE